MCGGHYDTEHAGGSVIISGLIVKLGEGGGYQDSSSKMQQDMQQQDCTHPTDVHMHIIRLHIIKERRQAGQVRESGEEEEEDEMMIV